MPASVVLYMAVSEFWILFNSFLRNNEFWKKVQKKVFFSIPISTKLVTSDMAMQTSPWGPFYSPVFTIPGTYNSANEAFQDFTLELHDYIISFLLEVYRKENSSS